jgi:hypothetical protein
MDCEKKMRRPWWKEGRILCSKCYRNSNHLMPFRILETGEKNCKECGKKIPKSRREFCSDSCSQDYSNRNYRPRH